MGRFGRRDVDESRTVLVVLPVPRSSQASCLAATFRWLVCWLVLLFAGVNQSF